jgi:hypothetical protein
VLDKTKSPHILDNTKSPHGLDKTKKITPDFSSGSEGFHEFVAHVLPGSGIDRGLRPVDRTHDLSSLGMNSSSH